MKTYTDLEQSRKLAEILPLESVDMRYGYIAPYDCSDRMYDGGYDKVPYPKDFFVKSCNVSPEDYDGELPCWSLVSLFDVLPKDIGDYRKFLYYDVGRYFCAYVGSGDLVFRLEETNADNPIDACYEMIIKLHGQNLL